MTETTTKQRQQQPTSEIEKTLQGPRSMCTELHPDLFGAIFSSGKIRSAKTPRRPYEAVLETRWSVGVGGLWFVSHQSVVGVRLENLLALQTHIGTVGLLLFVDNRKETSLKSHSKSINSVPPWNCEQQGRRVCKQLLTKQLQTKRTQNKSNASCTKQQW